MISIITGLLYIIGKIFEIIQRQNLTSYVNNKNTMSLAQLRFLVQHCKRAISNLIHYIIRGFNEKLSSSAVMFDPTKTFDYVNVNILLS